MNTILKTLIAESMEITNREAANRAIYRKLFTARLADQAWHRAIHGHQHSPVLNIAHHTDLTATRAFLRAVFGSWHDTLDGIYPTTKDSGFIDWSSTKPNLLIRYNYHNLDIPDGILKPGCTIQSATIAYTTVVCDVPNPE